MRVFFLNILISCTVLSTGTVQARNHCIATAALPQLIANARQFFVDSTFPEPFKKFIASRLFERVANNLQSAEMALWIEKLHATEPVFKPRGDWFYIPSDAKMWRYKMYAPDGSVVAKVFGNVEVRGTELFLIFDSIEIYEGGKSSLRDGQSPSSLSSTFLNITAGIALGVSGVLEKFEGIDKIRVVTMGTVHARLGNLFVDKWGWTRREHYDDQSFDDLTRTMTEENADANVELIPPQDQEITSEI